LALILTLGLFGLSGCGYKPKLPPLAQVSGTVTLDGKPLARGTVQFVPDSSKGTAGTPAVGYIDANGHYELTTANVPGAIIGMHRIGVESRKEMEPTGVSWTPSLIPEKYSNPNASGLTAEVKADTANEVNLELKSTGP
jgi:hypothetical protein